MLPHNSDLKKTDARQFGMLSQDGARVAAALRDGSDAVATVVLKLLGLIAFVAMLVLLFASRSGEFAQDMSRVAVAAAVAVGVVATYYFARQGRLRLGIGIAIGIIYIAIVVHAVLAGFGIHTYLLGTIGLVISASYLLISIRVGHIATAVSMCTVLALYLVEAAGVLFQQHQWTIPARNVLAVYLLIYAVSAITGARYSNYFAVLIGEINRQANQLREIIHTLPSGCMLSRDGTVLLANDLFNTHINLDPAQNIEDQPLSSLLPQDVSAAILANFENAKAMSAGSFLPPHEWTIVVDGERRHIRWETRIILHDGIAALLTVSHDVTERNAILRALEQERKLAIQATEVKSTFLATMSHEIRTPLNAVIGLTDLMRDDDLDEPTRKEYLNLVIESSETLLAMLNDVLDMSKVEAGMLAVRRELVDINAICMAVDKVYTPLIAERGLTFAYQPSSTTTMFVLGDPLRIRQILNNLMSNALKFTRAGSINLVARCLAQQIEIDITDTGIGIAPDDQARLFTPFVQADGNNTREFGGTGLGLALCRELATRMQGHIVLESSVGKGSTFRLVLPRYAGDSTRRLT